MEFFFYLNFDEMLLWVVENNFVQNFWHKIFKFQILNSIFFSFLFKAGVTRSNGCRQVDHTNDILCQQDAAIWHRANEKTFLLSESFNSLKPEMSQTVAMFIKRQDGGI